jgi:hypothetical protein
MLLEYAFSILWISWLLIYSISSLTLKSSINFISFNIYFIMDFVNICIIFVLMFITITLNLAATFTIDFIYSNITSTNII